MSEMLRGTADQQRRFMVRVGALAVALALLIWAIAAAWPQRRPPNTVEITLSTPTVGQGIDAHSHVLLRGVAVGSVTAITRNSGLMDMRIRLDNASVRGLTDALGYDFRPENSFGLSAVNLIPRDSGNPLVEGQRIERAPDTNATMSQLLNGAVTLVNGVITEKMVRLIQDTANYAGAIAPLLETGFLLANQIAETQQSDSAVLVQHANTILGPLPQLLDSALTSTHNLRNLKGNNHLYDDIETARQTLDLVSTGLFGLIGQVLGKHIADFTPTTEIVRSFLDSVSTIVQRSRGGLRLDKVLAGLQNTYGGQPGSESLKLRVLLEPLPVVESGLPPLSDLDRTGGR
ncbi:hypothetical protein BKG69_13130 [Mycobacteroides chelonae]|uniref:MlaD family protein n=1 Tax=Mycobacteroides chelonae TaxID=1774 RepID=UPI0008A8A0AB|nr:MlaD family protein [Mycobacteroides chelonae]OHT79329.1 hypothetical protein BKG69_13130 [Mycobacteroides chelonae]